MKNQKVIVFFLFTFCMIETVYGQSSSFGFHGEIKGGIVNTEHFANGESTQAGFGIGLGKRLLINEELGLLWVSELGFSIWLSCMDSPSCPSWWYAYPISLATGIGKTISFKSHRITPSVRIISFYGRKQVGGGIAQDSQTGEIISESANFANEFNFGPSFRIDYQNYEIVKKIGFLLQVDIVSRYTIGQVGLTYSFKQ